MGITADQPTVKAAPVPVWSEHVEAFEVFLACSGQWRVVTGMAGAFHQGIDAAALAATMAMLEVADRRRCLYQIRQIEAGALEVLNAP